MHADVSTDRPVVFYDGGCPLCRREIAHYRRLDRLGHIEWADITAQPEQLEAHGIAWAAAMQRLHMRETDGRIVTGAYAFAALWRRLPYYRVLAALVSLPGVLWVLERIYARFATWRWKRRCSEQCGLDRAPAHPVQRMRLRPESER